jgi:hypothetical protein
VQTGRAVIYPAVQASVLAGFPPSYSLEGLQLWGQVASLLFASACVVVYWSRATRPLQRGSSIQSWSPLRRILYDWIDEAIRLGRY